MIGVSLLVYAMAWSGHIERFEGAVLMLMAVAYTLFTIRRAAASRPRCAIRSRRSSSPIGTMYCETSASPALVSRCWSWAPRFGERSGQARTHTRRERAGHWPDDRGCGNVAPEVATSFMAAARGEREIAVGNVIGSNIFNLVAVLGCSALVSPSGVAVQRGALAFDIPVMVAAAVACLPVFAARHLIARWEGALFLGYYVAYTLYVVLHSRQHDALPLFSQVMAALRAPAHRVDAGPAWPCESPGGRLALGAAA